MCEKFTIVIEIDITHYVVNIDFNIRMFLRQQDNYATVISRLIQK